MAIVQVRPRQTGEFKSVPVGWGKVNAKDGLASNRAASSTGCVCMRPAGMPLQ